MSEEGKIVIDEVVGEVKEEEGFDIEGLDDQQLELAKEHGLYVEKEEDDEEQKEGKEDEHKEQSESESEEDSEGEPEEEEEEEINKDPDNFEEMDKVMEKDEKKFHNTFSPNQKALYFKAKADKHKRQELQKELETLKEKMKESSGSVAVNEKLEKIKEALKSDGVTVEALESIINEEVKEEKKNELDNAEVIKQKIAVKAKFADDIGQSKYKNFNDISNLAKKVIQNDKTGLYQKIIDDAFVNDNIDESMLVETVVNIARLDPSYQKVSGKVDSEKQEKVNRVIKNSKKKVSSASVTGASGRKIISESDLTVEDAKRLSAAQWEKLKPETRQRLLMG